MKLEKLNREIHVLTKTELGTVFGGRQSGEGTFIKSKVPGTGTLPDGTKKNVIIVTWRDYSSDIDGCYDWAGGWRESVMDA